MKKTKLGVIRPTLRHKKRYVLIKLINPEVILDSKKIYSVLTQSLQKACGIFVQTECNITILEIESKSQTLLIRTNKEYLDEFIGSLFFAQAELGLIKILEIKSTIKKLDGDLNDEK